MNSLKDSLKETLLSVGPVVIVIFLLQAFFAPMPAELMVRFLIGAVFIILGLVLFNNGVSVGMEPMGEEIGSAMGRSRRLWIIIIGGFVIGFFATLAEPDVQVLTKHVKTVSEGSISATTLLLSVGIGVGIMVVIALLRILMQWPYHYLLWIVYSIIFVLSIFANPQYIPIGFDAGGVTTGPMTVPFIMSLGIGISFIRGDRTAKEDSFGLIGIVSAGPILAVLILGVIKR